MRKHYSCSMKSGLKVVAPASISNLACGFDILGMALDVTGDEIIGKWSDGSGIRINGITGQKMNISADPLHNIAAISAAALLKHLGEEQRGLELKIIKHIPPGSGLGSSASSATAAVMLVNEMLNRPLEKKDLIPFAIKGEMYASGTPVGDNVISSLLGGLILIRDIDTLDYHRIYTPKGLFVAVLLPDISIATKEARDILQKQIALNDMVTYSANLASFVIGMHQCDLELIKRSMTDNVIEPQRKHLIPHFDNVKNTALDLGALGCSISGAGPAIFALCQEKGQASEIAAAMKTIYDTHKMASRIFVSGINHEGAKVM